MTTRQNTVRSILHKLTGKEPDEAHVAQMANIAEAVGIAPTDALFPLMVALDYYRVAYSEIPAEIREASAFVLREHAAAFRVEARCIEVKQKARLAEATKALMEAHKTWIQQVLPAILHEQLRETACKALDTPLRAAVGRMERATEAARDASQQLRALGNEHTWARFGAMMMAALAAGAAASLVAVWMLPAKSAPALTERQRTLLGWGSATAAVWPKLPAEAQGIILAEVDAGTTAGQEPHPIGYIKPARQVKNARPRAKRKEQNGQAEQDQMAEPDPQQPGAEQ